MSYVVWAKNHHFYYPYEVKTAYLRIDALSRFPGWTLDKNQATKFSNFDAADFWYEKFMNESNQPSRTAFDIVLGIGKV